MKEGSPEVVAPLAAAVCLVNCDEGQAPCLIALFQLGHEPLALGDLAKWRRVVTGKTDELQARFQKQGLNSSSETL